MEITTVLSVFVVALLITVVYLINKNEQQRLIIKKLTKHGTFFTPPLYAHFHYLILKYNLLLDFNTELYNVFRKYYINTHAVPSVSDSNFKLYIKMHTGFSKDWQEMDFPTYTQENIQHIVDQLHEKTYGTNT